MTILEPLLLLRPQLVNSLTTKQQSIAAPTLTSTKSTTSRTTSFPVGLPSSLQPKQEALGDRQFFEMKELPIHYSCPKPGRTLVHFCAKELPA